MNLVVSMLLAFVATGAFGGSSLRCVGESPKIRVVVNGPYFEIVQAGRIYLRHGRVVSHRCKETYPAQCQVQARHGPVLSYLNDGRKIRSATAYYWRDDKAFSQKVYCRIQ